MAVTPNEILAISEDIEAIYQRTVDDLLINIARHFNITGWERTRYWEIKKLSEMGALTKESADIISKNTRLTPEEVEKAFLQVSEKACLDIDPQLKEAAAKGLLQDPGTTPTTSLLMRQMVQGYVDQAVDTLNMVNTTMLESTRQAFLKGITTAVNEAMLQEAKEIVEAGAIEVATGQETKVRAIRKAMDQMAREGITGFYDRAGRKWSPDGYVAMVIRSTSHNAAIEAVKTRQQEYGGGDIFQVSSHPGARPLCYPYQGKFFSWSEGPGEFKDGAGHTQHYDNITNSSYGEPAGLFGINCGHHPIPIIPGYSYPQEYEEQSPEENKKEYEESQKQRQYERQVREAKRDLAVAEATGDEEAIKAAKQKVAQEQAKIRAYTKETGRVRRYDREQIGSTRDTDYGMADLRRQRVEEPLTGGSGRTRTAAPVFNRSGKEIVFEERKATKERIAKKREEQTKVLRKLSGEYNTRLERVSSGAKQAAGEVDITGMFMKLSSSNIDVVVHEFAHTLANTEADKAGLTNDQDFWKEIRQIRTKYRKAVAADYTKHISSYADHNIDEFMAEAFTLAKANELGIDLPDVYNEGGLEYAGQVLGVIDKFFKK